MDDDKMKESTGSANIFVTDKILSVIMTMIFNSRPWHLKIQKVIVIIITLRTLRLEKIYLLIWTKNRMWT